MLKSQIRNTLADRRKAPALKIMPKLCRTHNIAKKKQNVQGTTNIRVRAFEVHRKGGTKGPSRSSGPWNDDAETKTLTYVENRLQIRQETLGAAPFQGPTHLRIFGGTKITSSAKQLATLLPFTGKSFRGESSQTVDITRNNRLDRLPKKFTNISGPDGVHPFPRTSHQADLPCTG